MVFVRYGKYTYGTPRPVKGIVLVFDVRTSQKTHLQASMTCYGDSFTSLYIDDIRTSQETHMGLHGLLRG
jgi:hypothetical protein